MTSSYFHDWTGSDGTEVVPGDVIWSVTGQRVQVIRAEMAAGCDFPPHVHDHEQIIVVLEGQLMFSVGGEERLVARGQVIHAPPGVPHGGRVVGDERVVTIEALQPPRLDFSGHAGGVDLSLPK
jgi:quercetin dioxygenase-like cupin family protein